MHGIDREEMSFRGELVPRSISRAGHYSKVIFGFTSNEPAEGRIHTTNLTSRPHHLTRAMEAEGSGLTDLEPRTDALTHLSAAAGLEVRFRQPLERYLVGMCDKCGGRSQKKALEIKGRMPAEWLAKSPSLFEKCLP